MNKNWKIIYLMALLIITYHHSTTAQDSNPITLTVEVHNLRNEDGMVQFALYNQDGSLPDERFHRAYKIGRSSIVNHSSVYEFKGLPPGMYAVNILHDENNNKAIDKGIIKPKEGVGFSNFTTIGFTNRPTFSKAMFELSGDRTIEVKVNYF